MSEERKYVPVKQRSRSQIEELLVSGAPEQIGEALWSVAYYDPDWRWVQTQCLLALRHSDVWCGAMRRRVWAC